MLFCIMKLVNGEIQLAQNEYDSFEEARHYSNQLNKLGLGAFFFPKILKSKEDLRSYLIETALVEAHYTVSINKFSKRDPNYDYIVEEINLNPYLDEEVIFAKTFTSFEEAMAWKEAQEAEAFGSARYNIFRTKRSS